MNVRKLLIIKSLLYRLSATVIVFLISLIITGNTNYSVKISFLELISKTIFYYIYDIIWIKIIKKYKTDK